MGLEFDVHFLEFAFFFLPRTDTGRQSARICIQGHRSRVRGGSKCLKRRLNFENPTNPSIIKAVNRPVCLHPLLFAPVSFGGAHSSKGQLLMAIISRNYPQLSNVAYLAGGCVLILVNVKG